MKEKVYDYVVDLNIRGANREQYDWFQAGDTRFMINKRKASVGFR